MSTSYGISKGASRFPTHRHGHPQTLTYSFYLQPRHPKLGTHTFSNRTEPSDAETFLHITEHRHQKLSLISWNIDAFSSHPISRTNLILGHILEGLISSFSKKLQLTSGTLSWTMRECPRTKHRLRTCPLRP